MNPVIFNLLLIFGPLLYVLFGIAVLKLMVRAKNTGGPYVLLVVLWPAILIGVVCDDEF